MTDFTCTDCGHKQELPVSFAAETYVCIACHRMFDSEQGSWVQREKLESFQFRNAILKPGTQGFLKGEKVTVCGFLVKRVYGQYYWREYLLLTEKGKTRWLSESEGHWILLDEYTGEFKERKVWPLELDFQDVPFRKYENAQVEMAGAAGFFDYELPRGTVRMIEYIAPPLLLSVEKSGDDIAVFTGEHLRKSEMKKAFPTERMPYRAGVGIVQPFAVDLRDAVVIFLSVILFMIVAHWSIFRSQHETEVLDVSLPFSEFDQKEYTSPSFDLKGGAAPMSILVNSDVDNSWANLDITLVNEATNEEINANKDIEYYHGYEGGENWSEGSQFEDFNICGVREGRYHLVLSPMKAPEDAANSQIRVKAKWNEPSWRNVIFLSIIMVVLIIGLFILNYQFNRRRWMDSDYSPYPENTEE